LAMIDTEFSFDPNYATQIGVNTDPLIVCQPESGEQALNVLKQLIQLGVKMIVVDSVAALTTEAEIMGNIGDAHIAQTARLMSGGLKILTSEIGKNNAIVFFTNQIREKIGVKWGNPNTTPGGRSLKFYASLRVETTRTGMEKAGEEKTGAVTKVECVKNKTFPPFRRASVCIRFGEGFDIIGGVIDAALKDKIIIKKGAWFSYDGENIGQGRAATHTFLKENPDIIEKIKKQISGEEKVKPPEEPEEPEGTAVRIPVPKPPQDTVEAEIEDEEV